MSHTNPARSRRGLVRARYVALGQAGHGHEFFVAAESVQAYHIYFPDPWPKKRHHKRRLFDEDFVREVERTLDWEGHLWLATDFVEYFDVMLESLETSQYLKEVDREWVGVRTNYEQKYLAQGKTIHRRVLQKIPT